VASPFFSVVVTTYNRGALIRRCLDSCLAQSFEDFELVVVDDCSTDDTAAVLRTYEDPRLKPVLLPQNRGINPARRAGVENARGEWVVVVDSDWELLPHTLERLREVIAELPPDVRVIRSQLLWDDGSVTPHTMPAATIGYEERIRWVEEEGGYDAGRCIARAAFERTPYIEGRRGAQELLFELNLARAERTLCLPEVLGREHSDAANSYLRSTSAAELIPRLLAEAPDQLWMAETTLREHGEALRREGPRQYRELLRVASMQALLLGDRGKGLRYGLAALRRRPWDLRALATLVFGLLGRRAAARGILLARKLSR
jgi:hypothetical protein